MSQCIERVSNGEVVITAISRGDNRFCVHSNKGDHKDTDTLRQAIKQLELYCKEYGGIWSQA